MILRRGRSPAEPSFSGGGRPRLAGEGVARPGFLRARRGRRTRLHAVSPPLRGGICRITDKCDINIHNVKMKPYDTPQDKKEQVREMFDRIAPAYDRLNHVLSFQIDKLWRRRVVRIVRRMEPRRILDVATGTGDLALALARRIRGVQVLGVDLSENMLAEARRKAIACGLDERVILAPGDAERLEVADASVDVATVAFGVRNFGDMEAGLGEIARVLRPGGAIVVLEFSTPDNPLFRKVYRWYSHRLLPAVGGMVSRDRKAYEYLPASVDEFPAPGRFLEMLREAGFAACRARSLSMGIARIYIGEKPERP